MTKIKVLIVISFLILFNLCHATAPKFTKGKLVKGTIDGCSWLIELQNKKILQPVNITKFSVKLRNGKRVKLKYNILKNTSSFCMMGDMIEILEIK